MQCMKRWASHDLIIPEPYREPIGRLPHRDADGYTSYGDQLLAVHALQKDGTRISIPGPGAVSP